MKIRRYRPGEEAEIWNLYFNTTRKVISRDYTAAQVERWAPEDRDLSEWAEKLAGTNPFVAVVNDQIVGFAELEPDGHIDNFYCHHDWQRRGAWTALLVRLEAEAASLGLTSLYAEVSVTAEPFFSAMGFDTERERVRIVCGSPAKQFIMRKTLSSAAPTI